MAEAKPLATWMFEQQKISNDRNYRLQNAAMLANAMGHVADVGATVLPAGKGFAPTHDWQHSDDLAAHRAMGLEKQYTDAALDKDKMAFQMQLRAKYAPKGGRLNPMDKLWKEYWDTHDRTDYSSKETQKAHLAGIVERAKRLPGGQAFIENITNAKALPTDYSPGIRKSDNPIRTVEIREQGAGKRFDANMQQKQADSEMRAQEHAADRDLKATSTVARVKVDPFGGSPEVAAQQAKAVGKLSKYKSPVYRRNPTTGDIEEDVPDEE